MIKNLRLLASLIVIAIVLFPLITGVKVYSQQQLEEEIEIRMDTYGGNVKTLVKIRGDALTNMDILKAYIPKSFYNETTDFIQVEGVDQNDETVPLDFTLSDIDDNYLLQVRLEDGVKTVVVNIYQPEEIIPVEPRRYLVRILSYLKLNADVRMSDVVIRPPLDVSGVAEELPIGYSQAQVSPEGVTPAQFEISRVLSEADIRILNKTLIEEIPLRQATSTKTSLILADAWVNMTLYPSFEGKLHGEMNIKLENKDLITWPRDTEIQLREEYKVIEAKTELGLPVDIGFTGRLYKLKIPYDVRPGDKITFSITFSFEENVTLTSDIIPHLDINIKIPPPTDIPIDRFVIVKSWDNERIDVGYFTARSDRVEIRDRIPLDIPSILNQTGLSYILFTLFSLTIGLIGYRGITKLLEEEIPEDVKKYLDSFVKEIELMGQVINLERRHLEGKVRDKDYIKEKSRIQKKIKELRRSSSKYRETLVRLAKESKALNELLEDIKEVEKAYDELNKLEDSRRRRAITLEQYKEMRKEMITKFEIYSTKVKKRL